MFCQNCGSNMQPGLACSNCGARVVAAQQQSWSGPASGSSTNGTSTVAIVLGIIALFIVPILFGGIGIALAIVAKNRGESRADVALGVSIVGTVAGVIFGAVVGSMVGL